ncbi:ankyrin repeat domain-containing protein [Endozoicomonas sp. ISHI1]|uniref:ankyrin repeat domain-containing protein n=1 Tax=Endozoicomonas sp. ISHI1 TaxID=2825882 RepID=UPI0021486299|nr:ankyrin repeat domain-containing protein [Endozoicomonas sp. ISHI1]
MIKHSLFAAPLLLMTLSVVCQAQTLTRRFVVELEQKAGSPSQNVFIKPHHHTLLYTLSDIAHTKGYTESDLPPDEKQGRLNDCELKTTVIESISWPWLYANYLLVGYELIVTTKNTPLSSTSYSWLPLEVFVAVGWLLKSYWNIDSPSFNPIKQKELRQDHPLAAIISVPGSGNNQQQHPPSESSGQQAQEATIGPSGSFNSVLDSDFADGDGGSEQHLHTLGLDCFVFTCHGVCQFRPSSDSSEPTEWQMNAAEHSTGHKEATPEQSSCSHLDNGHCSECTGHVTNTDVLTMDGTAHLAVPMDTDAPVESDPCPICLVHFHGRDAVPVVLKAQCCGHHFDLDCISKCFVDQPIGSRRCAMCRQNPMPVVNVNTGESHPDEFFPDWTFYRACLEGELDQVEKSLAEGVNVNAVIDDDFTALMLASGQGHKDIVERLIDAGADLNARINNGATSLFIAAQKNKTDCVRILIEARADPNAARSNGATPLFIAAQENNTDSLKLLIEAKADLNARTNNDVTPLLIAAKKNNTDCVKLLIEAKADFNIRNKDGVTPLFIAAQENNIESVKILIETEADLNARTKDGVTSLYIAAQLGHTDIVKVLIEAGADPNAALSNGATPLYIAAGMGNTGCVKLLINAGADLNSRALDGATPLFIAAQENNTGCVKLLINAGADLNAALSDGTTPLSIATETGSDDCVFLLINAGAR